MICLQEGQSFQSDGRRESSFCRLRSSERWAGSLVRALTGSQQVNWILQNRLLRKPG